MATIFKDGWYSMGFDMSPSGANVFTAGGSAGGGNVGSANSANTPYSFGFSWALNNQFSIIGLGTNLTTLYCGFWLKLAAYPGTSNEICAYYDVTAAARQCHLRVYSDGHVQFCTGNSTTTIGTASSAGVIPLNTWVHIQTKVTIDAAAGVVECKINNSSVIASSGLNTKSTANTWVSGLLLSSINTTSNTYYDDLWMLDNSGSSPFNTYLGIIQVKGEKPSANSGVGGRNAYTPSNPQNDNHLNVGNVPASTSQFNSDNNTGDYDMFQFPSLSTASSVLALNCWVTVGQDAGGSHTIGIDCYSSGTDAIGSAITPAGASTPSFVNQTFSVDPHTSAAWGVSAAGSAELGIKTLS